MRNPSIPGTPSGVRTPSSLDGVTEREARPASAGDGRRVHRAAKGDNVGTLVPLYFANLTEGPNDKPIPPAQVQDTLRTWLERAKQIPMGGWALAAGTDVKLPHDAEVQALWHELRSIGGLKDGLSSGSSQKAPAPDTAARRPTGGLHDGLARGATSVGSVKQKISRGLVARTDAYTPKAYKPGPKLIRLGDVQARLVDNASLAKLPVSKEPIAIKDARLQRWLAAEGPGGPSGNQEHTNRAALKDYIVQYVRAEGPPEHPISAWFFHVIEMLIDLFCGPGDDLLRWRELGIESPGDLRKLSVHQAAMLAQRITVDALEYFHEMIEPGAQGERTPEAQALAATIDTLGVAELLGGGRGVCRNYAEATAAVFDALRELQDQPTPLSNAYMRTVSGADHAWNVLAVAQAGGQVMLTQLDPTWADTGDAGQIRSRDFSFEGAPQAYAPEGDRTFWLESSLIDDLGLMRDLQRDFAQALGGDDHRVSHEQFRKAGGAAAAYALLDGQPMPARYRCFGLLDGKAKEEVLAWAASHNAPVDFLFPPERGRPEDLAARSPRGRQADPVQSFARFITTRARTLDEPGGVERMADNVLMHRPELVRALAAAPNPYASLSLALMNAGVKHGAPLAKAISDRVAAWTNDADPLAVQLWTTAQERGAMQSPIAFARAFVELPASAASQAFRAAWKKAGSGEAMVHELTRMFEARGLTPATQYAQCLVGFAVRWAPPAQAEDYVKTRVQLLADQIAQRGTQDVSAQDVAVAVWWAGVGALGSGALGHLDLPWSDLAAVAGNVDVPALYAAGKSPAVQGPASVPYVDARAAYHRVVAALRPHRHLFPPGKTPTFYDASAGKLLYPGPSTGRSAVSPTDIAVLTEHDLAAAVAEATGLEHSRDIAKALTWSCAEKFLNDVRRTAEGMITEARECIDEVVADPAQLAALVKAIEQLPSSEGERVREALNVDGALTPDALRTALLAARARIATSRLPPIHEGNHAIINAAPGAVLAVQQRWGVDLTVLSAREPPGVLTEGLDKFADHRFMWMAIYSGVAAAATGVGAGVAGLAESFSAQFLIGFLQNMSPTLIWLAAKGVAD